jgi:hypothetical protein
MFMPTFCMGDNCNGWPGYAVLGLGWLGLLTGYLTDFIWLANPLLFASWLAIRLHTRRPAVACSATAFGLGAAFLLASNVMVSESGYPSPVSGYRGGYWLWLASMGLAWASAKQIESADQSEG